MLHERHLQEVISDQRKRLESLNNKPSIARAIDYQYLIDTHLISVITGVRRSGKSTVLQQLTNQYTQFYYINFDDERLFDFQLSDFQTLMLVFKQNANAKVIFLDEIQNILHWERFVRRIYDDGFKIYITGSNAKLLSSELATHLTGRYTKTELYPFSFPEYLRFHQIDFTQKDSDTKSQIIKHFNLYMQHGGFPEFVVFQDKMQLQIIYEDIIAKDLIARFGIKNVKAFKQLAHYYYSNFTKEISYNSLKTILGISSANTIKDYTEYLMQAYLVFEIYKFDYSLKQQLNYAKKVYTIDNGLRNSIAFRFNTDLGQLLENIMFIHLKKSYNQVWFYKTKQNHEVDFCVQTDKQLILFQVSYELENNKTRQREIRSLQEAMQELKSSEAHIITYNQFDTVETDSGTIEVMPFWYYATRYLVK